MNFITILIIFIFVINNIINGEYKNKIIYQHNFLSNINKDIQNNIIKKIITNKFMYIGYIYKCIYFKQDNKILKRNLNSLKNY